MHARMHATVSRQKCQPCVSACVISLVFFALLFPWEKVAMHGPWKHMSIAKETRAYPCAAKNRLVRLVLRLHILPIALFFVVFVFVLVLFLFGFLSPFGRFRSLAFLCFWRLPRPYAT